MCPVRSVTYVSGRSRNVFDGPFCPVLTRADAARLFRVLSALSRAFIRALTVAAPARLSIDHKSRDPLASASYQEMVRAWIMLAESAEQLVSSTPFIRCDLAQVA